MKIAVMTGKSYPNLAQVALFLHALDQEHEIVTNFNPDMKRHVMFDSLVYNAALIRNMKVTCCPIYWGEFGVSAGYVRNATIAEGCDHLVTFWSGIEHDKGPRCMIDVFGAAKKPWHLIVTTTPTRDLFDVVARINGREVDEEAVRARDAVLSSPLSFNEVERKEEMRSGIPLFGRSP